ncbi:WecB/TagA/CpsF family glycosyltransferase [Amphritea japonica]|uniref:Glycosyltransferase n=1 Tax=Amphritea japonica ATCC BAA-1530 TaxID=1278309 RepID=A0A7R6PC84_9GAMM|nr:WecB/TagA/CpsF family glycosyltransferase [Amphritea japonica]BBB25451.1 conserved hypothetical protein [Amphritea japonica ATCC BAA-1530]
MDISKVLTTNVGGIKTACLNRKELAQVIGEYCATNKEREPFTPILIFSNNGHAISIANRSEESMNLLKAADLIHADGQSVVTFSGWTQGPSIKERSATTDMIHDLPNFYNSELKHFLLGGKEEIVNNAAAIMQERYTNFKVAGTYHGYFSGEDEQRICALINESGADVLWVGLGKPKEQEFCIRNRKNLKVSVIITCGGCYNYITGDYSRAPRWVQEIGLEWLHRMSTNPTKLLYRYLTTNPHAIYCVLKHRFSKERG